MAFPTSTVGVRKGRVLHNILMGNLPVRLPWIAAVTGLACYFPVAGVYEGRIDIDFFIRLQRSHAFRSAFTGGFRRVTRSRPDLCDLGAQADYCVQVGMAGDTLIFWFCWFSLCIPAGGSKEGCNNKDHYFTGCTTFYFQHTLHGKLGPRGKEYLQW